MYSYCVWRGVRSPFLALFNVKILFSSPVIPWLPLHKASWIQWLHKIKLYHAVKTGRSSSLIAQIKKESQSQRLLQALSSDSKLHSVWNFSPAIPNAQMKHFPRKKFLNSLSYSPSISSDFLISEIYEYYLADILLVLYHVIPFNCPRLQKIMR